MQSTLQTSDSDFVSIRDYFAIQVLNGLLSYAWFNPMEDEELYDRIRMSYRVADAMLEVKNESKRKRQQTAT